MKPDNTVQEFVYLMCAMVLACGIYFGLRAMPQPQRYQIVSGELGFFVLDTASGHVWRYYRNEDKTEGFMLLPVQHRREADWLGNEERKWATPH